MTTRTAEQARMQGTGGDARRNTPVPDQAFSKDWAVHLASSTNELPHRIKAGTSATRAGPSDGVSRVASALSNEVMQERLRIAQELHDGALQLLGCVRLNVERLLSQGRLDQQAIQTELELCLEWLDAGLIELRHSVVGLREGKGESLLPSLQRLVEDVRRFYKLDVDLSWQVQVALPELMQSTVLRVAQEALHNAAKHAHADRVRISVQARGRELTLTVQDNGVGIDEGALQAPSGSARYGLMDMHNKAAAAGGALEITGPRGRGTRVALVLPLRRRAGRPDCAESLRLSPQT